jgi:hypothetical protein
VAARRLLIVMLVLLGVSTLAAVLVPPPDSDEDDQATTSTAATETTAGEPTGTVPDTLPPGERKTVAIKVGGKEKIKEVPIELGDRLELTICSPRSDLIEIPRLGLVEGLAPGSPARVDVLPPVEGTYGINFLSDGKLVARIRVNPPTKEAPGGPGPAATSDRCEPAAP